MEITHNLKINASAETIYKAVSTKAGIRGWWAKDCSVGEVEGERSLLNFNKEGAIVPMGFKTETLITGKKVVWECTENKNPAWLGTRIVTKITETKDTCEVIFSHTNFDEKWRGQDPFEMTKQGWDHFVASLISFCETGKGQPW